MNDELTKIIRQANGNRMLSACREFLTFIRKNKIVALADEAEAVCRDYDYMLTYVRRGVDDPQRLSVHESLKKRLLALANDADIILERPKFAFYTAKQKALEGKDFSAQAIRNELETYVMTMAMADIDPTINCKEVSRKHQDYISMLFVHLCLDTTWRRKDGDAFAEMLTSPTIESRDAQMIISAVTLACSRFFDPEKWRMLTEVYMTVTDESIRQRALVGWATTRGEMKNEMCDHRLREMCLSGNTQNELLQLQMEIFYSARADEDQKTISNEIMPGIIRNSNLKITRNGIEENDEDDIDAILNPEIQDNKIKEIEQYYTRIKDMQQQGSDVYYGGFSYMKRYAFFYNIANWFTPYYDAHPDLLQVTAKACADSTACSDFMGFIKALPLCDSDKYSLALSLGTITQHLNSDNIEMMKMGAEHEMETMNETPESIRRNYLHSLYRFYKLFPNETPFVSLFDVFFFGNGSFFATQLKTKAFSMLQFLDKNGRNEQFETLFSCYEAETWNDEMERVFLLAGSHFFRKKDYAKASAIFIAVHNMSPKNITATKGLAKTSLLMKMYDVAERLYKILIDVEPDDFYLRSNYYKARIYNGKAEESLSDIFKMDFEAQESAKRGMIRTAKRLLAFALMCAGRAEEAAVRYNFLEGDGNLFADDLANHAFALWLSGDTPLALQKLDQWIDVRSRLTRGDDGEADENTGKSSKEPMNTQAMEEFYRTFSKQLHLFRVYNKTSLDLRMLCELM